LKLWTNISLLLALVLWVQPIVAQERVMALGVSGADMASLELGRIHREIVEALGATGRWGLVERTDTNIDEIEFVMGCAAVTPTCLGEFADLVEADILVWSRVQRGADREVLSLTVTIWDPYAEVAREQDTLEVPSVRGTDWLPIRLLGLWADRPVVEIASPQAAYVEIDGVAFGAAPVITDMLAPGRHRVVMQYGAGSSEELSIDVPRTGFQRFETRAASVAAGGRTGRMSTGRAAGVVLWGTAAVAAGVGAVVASDANRIEESLEFADTQREAYELADRGRRFTRIANALFIGAGVTFTGGTVAFVRN
jgi:hypothetical protein